MNKIESSSLRAVSALSINREAHVDAVQSAWCVLAILRRPDITQSRRRYARTDVLAAGPGRRNFVALSHLHLNLSHLEYAPTSRCKRGTYINARSDASPPPPHAMPKGQRKRPLPPTPPSAEDGPQQKRQKTESLYNIYANLGPQLRLTNQALRVLNEHNKALQSKASAASGDRCTLPPTPPLSLAEILRHVKYPSAGLRRFAHQGGPDLGDIYQVSRRNGRNVLC
jgi:hypothetical protein